MNENSADSGRYKWFVLGILTIVYTFNFVDRQIVVILQEPIKAELGLSDSDLGLLTGFSFALIYVILGIPIARLADRSNRKNIIAASLALWSAMTAICGTVSNFMQMFLARFGVGVGEAGCSPPAHSIISDYFPPAKRATALSIYSSGIYFGIFLGYLGGGAIAAAYGWRYAFYAMGLPGIVLAVILYFVVKEPIKGQNDPAGVVKENPSLKEVVNNLFGKKTFIYLALGCGFHTFITYGVGNFLPSFLYRVHEVDLATIGSVLGLSTGLGGALGTFLGGYLGDRFRAKDMRWYLWIPIIAGLLSFVPAVVLYFTPNAQLAMIMTFFTGSLTAFYLAPCIAVTHSLVNAKMRSFASAILFFILNLIGMGGGPYVVGLISDYLIPEYGNLSLRWAFVATFVPATISLIFFVLAARNYKLDLAKAQV